MRLKTNPAKIPTNPKILLKDDWILLLDGNELIAGGSAIVFDWNGKFSFYYAAAKPGYGPLLYELAAYLNETPLYPSDSTSRYASQFWEKNEPFIAPLTPDQFKAKWGFDPEQCVHYLKTSSPEFEQAKRKIAMRASYPYEDEFKL